MSFTPDSLPGPSRDERKCLKCHKHVRKVPGNPFVLNTSSKVDVVKAKLQGAINIGDVLCHNCKKSFSFFTLESTIPTSQSSDEDSSYEVQQMDCEPPTTYVELSIPRTVATHRYCSVCRSKPQSLVTVPFPARIQCFQKKRLFIPSGNRCCQEHLIPSRNRFFDDELNRLQVFSNLSLISTAELSRFLEVMSSQCDATIMNRIGEFTISEKDLKVFTGLSSENIAQLGDLLVSMRKSASRSVTQALVTFLMKLRTGNSNALIASILGLDHEQQVSDYCHSVLRSFEKDVLPTRFGFSSISREDLIELHTSPVARKIHDIGSNTLALIFDGTYIRHEKSANNAYQRKSFSGQKKVPLCKPFTICTTNGFIVDVPGPFYANENDASIMRKLLSQTTGLCDVMKPGDMCFLDRGFRDVVPTLQESGFIVKMPALKGKKSQLSIEEANQSRLVTKVRWVVEAVHGIIGKKYRLLHNQVHNTMLPEIGLYVRIACFLHNMFGKRLGSDAENFEEITMRMLRPQPAENTLAELVEKEGWTRKKVIFRKVTVSEIPDFPEMSLNDLKVFFSGTYQLGQAISYLAEMTDEEGNVGISCLSMMPNVLKCEVRSRHINRKTYRCFIDYEPNSNGFEGIKRHCCDCANGLRTIGCCSHLAAIIYYLSHGRYLSRILRPAEFLNTIFTDERPSPVIDEDSDED